MRPRRRLRRSRGHDVGRRSGRHLHDRGRRHVHDHPDNIGSKVTSLTLDVTDVAESGWVYDSAANDETSITVNKP